MQAVVSNNGSWWLHRADYDREKNDRVPHKSLLKVTAGTRAVAHVLIGGIVTVGFTDLKREALSYRGPYITFH
jgi:hypothetical protein